MEQFRAYALLLCLCCCCVKVSKGTMKGYWSWFVVKSWFDKTNNIHKKLLELLEKERNCSGSASLLGIDRKDKLG